MVGSRIGNPTNKEDFVATVFAEVKAQGKGCGGVQKFLTSVRWIRAKFLHAGGQDENSKNLADFDYSGHSVDLQPPIVIISPIRWPTNSAGRGFDA